MVTFTKKQQELIDSLQPMELCISNYLVVEPDELVELLVGSRLTDIRHQYKEDKDDNLGIDGVVIETRDGSMYTLKLLAPETSRDYDIVDDCIDYKRYGPIVDRAYVKTNYEYRVYNEEDNPIIPRVLHNYTFELNLGVAAVDIVLSALTDSTDSCLQIIKTIKS